jgi:predicted DsbA family dithiol-disulfide isomerase
MRFDIELFFDTSCPFCFVGKKNLDAAIDKYQSENADDEFNLLWRPFILCPMSKVAGKRFQLYCVTLRNALEKHFEAVSNPYGYTLRSDRLLGLTTASRF